MNILLTNDDGIQSEGLWAIYHALSERHRVKVIAPSGERSAVGHGITLRDPVRIKTVTVNSGETGISVSGTPADCVKIGVLELLEKKPDMVISGINFGANVGIDINYSGTVAAAREASFYGIPSIAVSMIRKSEMYLKPQTDFLVDFVETVQKNQLSPGTFLNVNFPNLPDDEIKGIKITPHSLTFSKEYFDKRVDPKNETYYWHVMSPRYEKGENSDKTALYEDYITISPIKCDHTDYELLGNLSTWDIQSN